MENNALLQCIQCNSWRIHLFMKLEATLSQNSDTAWKVSKNGVFSGPYFPSFGLKTERYEVSLRIQSECGKIRTRKNSVFGYFSQNSDCNLLREYFWNSFLQELRNFNIKTSIQISLFLLFSFCVLLIQSRKF